MPPVRDHAVPQDDGADDDMPPLVDNPNPPMMSTFFTDMTPLSYPNTSGPTEPSSSTIPPTTTFSPESTASMTSTPPPSPEDTVVSAQAPITRGSHGKKRDASYIPRPPNAFILFRSSFIRSQQVPGKVEGNHSTLSKIIGMYWKTLPREEREKWEAKAVVAQAEHRRRYPDWRFRPGANAMAKLKVKDGGMVTRRRRARAKDPPEGDETVEGGENDMDGDNGADRKGKGKAKAKKSSGNEKRCAKIADLLVEGKKGLELEEAVKEWEGGRKSARDKWRAEKNQRQEEQEMATGSATVRAPYPNYQLPSLDSHRIHPAGIDDSISLGETQHGDSPGSPRVADHERRPQPRQRGSVPDNPKPALSTIPLTQMFKRSLSAPNNASPAGHVPMPPSPSNPHSDKSPYTPGATRTNHPRTRDTPHHSISSFPMSTFDRAPASRPPQLTWQEEEDRRRYEDTHFNQWWGPSESDSYPTSLTTEGMGYDPSHTGCFDQTYVAQFHDGTINHPRDGSHAIPWISSPDGRHGLVAVIHDRLQDKDELLSRDLSHPEPSPVSPDTLTSPESPDSPSTAYYTQVPSMSSAYQSSSFSTLSGWAGGPNAQENPSSASISGPGLSGISDRSFWRSQLQPMGLYDHSDEYEWNHMDTATVDPPNQTHYQAVPVAPDNLPSDNAHSHGPHGRIMYKTPGESLDDNDSSMFKGSSKPQG